MELLGRCNVGIKVEEQLRGTGFFLESPAEPRYLHMGDPPRGPSGKAES